MGYDPSICHSEDHVLKIGAIDNLILRFVGTC